MAATRTAFPDKSDADFQQKMLDAVNEYRRRHGAAALTLDDTLIDYAKSRAALMSTEEALNHGHAGLDSRYGENVYWGGSTSASPSGVPTAADNWYSEIKDYNFDDPSASDFNATGHFTALVWKATSKVGFGRVSGKGSKYYETYIVANFQQPGNLEGAYPANVGRAT
jgi:uncharacterized protein YkwD